VPEGLKRRVTRNNRAANNWAPCICEVHSESSHTSPPRPCLHGAVRKYDQFRFNIIYDHLYRADNKLSSLCLTQPEAITFVMVFLHTCSYSKFFHTWHILISGFILSHPSFKPFSSPTKCDTSIRVNKSTSNWQTHTTPFKPVAFCQLKHVDSLQHYGGQYHEMFKAPISCNVKVKAIFSFSQYLYMHIKLNSLMMPNVSINLTFRGPWIVIYSYNNTSEMN